MQPERILLDDLLNAPDASRRMERHAIELSYGALVVYPTETIYGIGGIATSENVRQRIIGAKQRTPENPLIIVTGDRSHLGTIPVCFPEIAIKLADHFWPGNLTLVLPLADANGTLGVRVSPHPYLVSLAKYLAVPLFSTSANYSGTPYQNDPDHIYDIFCNSIDCMVDAGILPPSAPSTVVKVDENQNVVVLREGAISKQQIINLTL